MTHHPRVSWEVKICELWKQRHCHEPAASAWHWDRGSKAETAFQQNSSPNESMLPYQPECGDLTGNMVSQVTLIWLMTCPYITTVNVVVQSLARFIWLLCISEFSRNWSSLANIKPFEPPQWKHSSMFLSTWNSTNCCPVSNDECLRPSYTQDSLNQTEGPTLPHWGQSQPIHSQGHRWTGGLCTL